MRNGMKESVFNFSYKRGTDQNIIYNTFSKAVVELTDEEKKNFEEGLYSSDLEQQLIENGILVSDDYDELGFLKYFHYKTKFSKEVLSLTIAPTLDCNFACPYCYENRQKGKMSPDIQSAICEYIEETIDDGAKTIDISWYGGEPLLCFDIVESMSLRIREICGRRGVILKMHMVTNGYLLTSEIVERLDEIGITRIQITLDGLAENHDRTRPLRSGKGTFTKIFDNLKLFDDSPVAVVIRMNVDNKNSDDYPKLRKMIQDLGNPNIDIYASPVEDINKDRINAVSEFMSTEQFEEFAIKACEDNGIGMTANDFAVMDNRYCFCTSETDNCYVVDNNGDFYKCWDEVGRTEYRCFNILDKDSINYSQIASFVAADPFSDEKCRNCTFLPLCFGGCKFQRAHLNKSVCGFTGQSLRQYLEGAYFSEEK